MAKPSDPADWDDKTLTQVIHEAQAGSADAQDELFTQVQAYLKFIANEHFQASGKAGVSDIVQQSMIRAVEKINGFRGSSFDEFKGWLRQIVVNEARQTSRKLRADKRDARRERSIDSPSVDSVKRFDFADSFPTPGTNAMADENAAEIMNALAKLPENFQQVIRLRNWDRMQFGQIAEQLSMSVSGAAKLWYRALVELQKQFGDGDE